MNAKPYQGHPSYSHWNVTLWIENDEGLYNLARNSKSAANLWRLLEGDKTPDGVKYSRSTVTYAWKSVHED